MNGDDSDKVISFLKGMEARTNQRIDQLREELKTGLIDTRIEISVMGDNYYQRLGLMEKRFITMDQRLTALEHPIKDANLSEDGQ